MKCSNCDAPASVAVRTGGRDSVRGLNTTVYYEPGNATRGAELLCRDHAVGLLDGLINILS